MDFPRIPVRVVFFYLQIVLYILFVISSDLENSFEKLITLYIYIYIYI